jgi:hypothetical protein
MTPTGRFRVGRRLSPRKAPAGKEGALSVSVSFISFIPWDVWLALALAVVALGAECWQSPQTALVVVYFAAWAYVVACVLTGKERA